MEIILNLNQQLFFLINGLSHQNQILDSAMIFGANYLIILMVLLSLYFCVKSKQQGLKILTLTLISLLVGFVLLKISHLLVYEQRPFVVFAIKPLISHLPDAAFPSEHTLFLTILSLPYWIYKSRYFKLFLIGLIWMGLSRIYVGVHYPLDILGGMVVGFLAILIGWGFIKLLKRKLLG